MTKRDFFKLIIKIFGLYSLIITVFGIIPTNIGFMVQQTGFASFMLILTVSLLVIMLFILLLFKSDLIINTLKLDKGFDSDTIDFKNFNENSILKLSAILIGAFLVVDNFTVFVLQCYKAFENKLSESGLIQVHNLTILEEVNYYSLIASGLSVLIGYLILTNYKRIANNFSKESTAT